MEQTSDNVYIEQSQSEQASQQASQQLDEDSLSDKKWFWAFPQIEGVPPCARGGHTATLIGASILFFGVRTLFAQRAGSLLPG